MPDEDDDCDAEKKEEPLKNLLKKMENPVVTPEQNINKKNKSPLAALLPIPASWETPLTVNSNVATKNSMTATPDVLTKNKSPLQSQLPSPSPSPSIVRRLPWGTPHVEKVGVLQEEKTNVPEKPKSSGSFLQCVGFEDDALFSQAELDLMDAASKCEPLAKELTQNQLFAKKILSFV